MPADISTALKNWSTTESSNSPSGGALVGGNLDDNLRALQVAVRALASSASVASAATVDLNAQDTATFLTVTGTSTITALGTVSAGIFKWLVFAGALTFTHNATSLILPTSASITTAAGDVALMLSLGSGNWRCLSYTRADGTAINSGGTVVDGTAATPAIRFGLDLDTGFYRDTTNTFGISAGGTGRLKVSDTAITGTVPASLPVGSNTAPSLTFGEAGIGIYGTTGSIHISTGSGSTSCAEFDPAANAITLRGDVEIGNQPRTVGNLTVGKHLVFDDNGVAGPTITSGGGTSPTITGSDCAFQVTLGAGPGTTCRVTFGTAFVAAPVCIANYGASNIAVRCQSTTTYVDLTFASAPAGGETVQVLCIGR